MRNFISSHKILFYSTKFDTEVRKVVLKSGNYIKIYSYIKSKVGKIKIFIYFASLFDTKSNFYDNLVLVENKYKRGGGNFEK